MQATSLMVLGTASAVGKSVICTALCRILHRKGVKVAPFKAQNISLNSFVTPDGKEIARSQALQALAAGIPPEGDMNPILLKPEARGKMHVLLGGEPVGGLDEVDLREMHGRFIEQVRHSYEQLSSRFEFIVMEGMGGAAEINLFDRDVSNFWAAEMADADVILVGNIEAGGVFASLYGTWALCPPHWRSRIRGFLINQLRGDPQRLGDGPAELFKRTGVPVIGVVPHVENFRLDAEDALDMARFPSSPWTQKDERVQIAAVRLPHLSNSTDIEPFLDERSTHLFLTEDPEDLRSADVVILPGSKCVAADLKWMRKRKWDSALTDFAGKGGILFGLCGGYQMLGVRVLDPKGIESSELETPGLSLLPIETTLTQNKILRQIKLQSCLPFFKGEVEGYEIHMGESALNGGGVSPAFQSLGADGREQEDGAVSASGRIYGTYLHGLFENDTLRNAFLEWVRNSAGLPPLPESEGEAPYRIRRMAQIDLWTDVVEQSVGQLPTYRTFL